MKETICNHLPRNFPWANGIIYYESIDSTNTRAKELAQNGAPHGTVLIAGSQTGGRGRMGRQFHSPAGTGVYLSVILRPGCSPEKLMHLTCATAVAMCSAIHRISGITPGIKWTNDLVFQRKKLGGILTELSLDPQTSNIDYAIVGIGINCRQQETDFPAELQSMATSLALCTGRDMDCASVAAAMIEALWEMDQKLLTEKHAMMEEYKNACVTLGQAISVCRGDVVRHGTALDVDEDGALLVRYSNGDQEFVTSGEVSIRGMYGYV